VIHAGGVDMPEMNYTQVYTVKTYGRLLAFHLCGR